MGKKISITGSAGRFGETLKRFKSKNQLLFPNKDEQDILNHKKIISYLSHKKSEILIHLAGLSRPMDIHDKDIKKIIVLNIVGTANITKACEKKKIKLIYSSTHYVYPGIKGNYKETDSVHPIYNFAKFSNFKVKKALAKKNQIPLNSTFRLKINEISH